MDIYKNQRVVLTLNACLSSMKQGFSEAIFPGTCAFALQHIDLAKSS